MYGMHKKLFREIFGKTCYRLLSSPLGWAGEIYLQHLFHHTFRLYCHNCKHKNEIKSTLDGIMNYSLNCQGVDENNELGHLASEDDTYNIQF